MNYYAGLDVSMNETHICVVERDGGVVLEAKASSTPEAIAAVLETAPACERIVLETGRMAPMLFHGLASLGLPVICIESRQAYQALKSLATHKTDRNDARGLAHLARTGFFKPVHVKSLPAHAGRALIIARKKLVGQRVTLENQIRGLVPRRFQSGEIDYGGSISKCGDKRGRTLLYEAATVMLTRYRGVLALKEWALGIARRSTMRKARVALARRLAIIMHAMLRHGTSFQAV